jgi:glycosyltransferase involved in cell wall biosynthesis
VRHSNTFRQETKSSRDPCSSPVVCFYARVPRAEILRDVAFYKLDLAALERCGVQIHVATRLRDVSHGADAYFVWWWTHALPIVLLARLRRRPVLITGTFNWFEGAEERAFHARPLWQRAIIRASAKLATSNLFVSKLELDAVTRGLHLTNGSYFPHAVETTKSSSPSRSETKHSSMVGHRYILNLAFSELQNLQRKCVFELIEAFERLGDSTLRLVLAGTKGDGEGALRARIESSTMTQNIVHLGAVSEATKAELLNNCFIYASPSRYEGFGLAIAEAAALRKPIVTSPVGAVPEVIGDGAVYCDGTDPAAIRDALRRLTGDEHLRVVMGNKAAAAVAKFSFDSKVETLGNHLRAAGLSVRDT